MLKVTWDQVLGWRLRRQFVDPPGDVSVGEVVGRRAGVQAQVASAAELAVGLRQAAPESGGVKRGADVTVSLFPGSAQPAAALEAEAARVAQVCGLDPLTVRIA